MSTKQTTGFTDLPWELKLKIMDSVDVVSKLAVRQSSRELRELADKSKYVYERLRVMFTKDSVRVQLQFEQYQSVHIEFAAFTNGYLMRNRNGSWCVYRFGPLNDMYEAVVHRVIRIFKTPRVIVKKFIIEVYCEKFPFPWPDFFHSELQYVKINLLAKFTEAMGRMFYKLSVGYIEVVFPASQEEICEVFELFDHEVVQSIAIRNLWPTTHPLRLHVSKIMKTRLWRRAWKLTIQGYKHTISVRQVMRFSVVLLEKYKMKCENLIDIIERYLTREDWCSSHFLLHKDNRDEILQVLSKHPNASVRPNQRFLFDKKDGKTALKVEVTSDNMIRLRNVLCDNYTDKLFIPRKGF